MRLARFRFLMQVWLTLVAAAFLSLVRPLPVALAAGAPAPVTTDRATLDVGPSIPIELPAGPATPSEDELAGGFHGVLILVGVVFVVVVLIAVAVDAGHYHHHNHWWHECEDHLHHHHAPSPPPS